MSSPSTTTKQVQSQFLSFIQSYKTLFNTTYSTLQMQQNLPAESQQSIQQKQFLINDLYHNYRQVVEAIDSLQEVHPQQSMKENRQMQDDDSVGNSMTYMGNNLNVSSTAGFSKDEQKYDLYEKEICQQHDKAVQRHKQAVKKAEIWREHLYKYINASMPSGGNH